MLNKNRIIEEFNKYFQNLKIIIIKQNKQFSIFFFHYFEKYY